MPLLAYKVYLLFVCLYVSPPPLTWEQLLTGDSFTIYEQKTGKRREIRINKGFQSHIKSATWPCTSRTIASPISSTASAAS